MNAIKYDKEMHRMHPTRPFPSHPAIFQTVDHRRIETAPRQSDRVISSDCTTQWHYVESTVQVSECV